MSKKKGKGFRFYKSIGLGFKIPKAAMEGSYVDKKCPFTGNVSIRGRIMKAMIIRAGFMKNTVVVRRDYLRFVKKYRRYVRCTLLSNSSVGRSAVLLLARSRQRRNTVLLCNAVAPDSCFCRPSRVPDFRFEKRHKNLTVHCSPAFENVKAGDIVTVGQCRPLSKTIRFNVVEHIPATNQSLNIKKSFRMF